MIYIIYAVDQVFAIDTLSRHVHHHVRIFDYHPKKKHVNNPLFYFSAKVEPKSEVKACYECKGVEACRADQLSTGSIRTSAVLGASNLYCYTVCLKKYIESINHFLVFISHRNLILKQVMLSLVVVSDLVKSSINILNAMLNTIYVAMKTCVTLKQLAIVLDQIMVPIINHINNIKNNNITNINITNINITNINNLNNINKNKS